jgi:hypothetical protein
MNKVKWVHFRSLDSAKRFASNAAEGGYCEYGTTGDSQCIRVYDHKNNKTHVVLWDDASYNAAPEIERGE